MNKKNIENDNFTIASFKSEMRNNKVSKTNKTAIKNDEFDVSNYRSFSIDFVNSILSEGHHKVIKFLSQMLDVEITYVIEKKIKNNQAHVHGYFISEKTVSEIKKVFHQILYGIHYDVNNVFNLNGWKGYMTKEVKTIYTVKHSF